MGYSSSSLCKNKSSMILVVFVVMGLMMSCITSRAGAYVVDDESMMMSNTKKLSYYNYKSNMRRRDYCSEIYQVKEGETLHSISDKCDDPYILENNPHIQQHDDVFPGLVIKITTSRNMQLNY
ncbi:hypothetical protein ACP275_02G169900 [Erythranthe tilingii]